MGVDVTWMSLCCSFIFVHRGGFGVPMNREEYYHIEPLDHHDSMVRFVEENSVSLV